MAKQKQGSAMPDLISSNIKLYIPDEFHFNSQVYNSRKKKSAIHV